MASAVARRRPPPERLGPQAAARALLGARAGYTASGEVKLAPYQAGAVALVDDASTGPSVHDVADGEARRFLDEWEQRMLRDDEDYEEQVRSEGPVEPYVDSVLRSNPKTYAKFVKYLRRRDLVRWMRCPKGRV